MKDAIINSEAAQDVLKDLVQVSRSIGEDSRYVLWGGGNSSVKVEEIDFRGQVAAVLRIKGTGVDMKTLTMKDFPGVRLDDIEALRNKEVMDDEEMVSYLAHCMIAPQGPRPSIETLLHGFLPHGAVIHSHADSILALANVENPEKVILSALGDRIVVVPYIRPGFSMAKTAAQAVDAMPGAEAMVLIHHGLVTWGSTPMEAYESHIDIVRRAEEFLENHPYPEVSRRARWSPDIRNQLVQRVSPLIRRHLGNKDPVVLCFADNEQLLAFTERDDLENITQFGAVTPDHLLHTKNVPLFIPVQPDMTDSNLFEMVKDRIEQYREEYRQYFERYDPGQFVMRSPDPVLVIVPGVGVWAAGSNPGFSRIPLDIYRHVVSIFENSEKIGCYQPLSESETFEAEYWPLELYKLTSRPHPKELQGKVAMVTGAAAGIGAAIAKRLVKAGAVVVVADRNVERLRDAAKVLAAEGESDQTLAVVMDVSDEDQVTQAYETTVRMFGGLDILVSNAGTAPTGRLTEISLAEWEASLRVNVTGHFLVARQALRLMSYQGLGGNVVFIVSKNALVPGSEFGAYSVAKAAELQLGRIAAIEHGADGIRVNMINPDAIWTDLWSQQLRIDRAKAYNIREEDLEDFYRRRSLLQRVVTEEDVAEGVLFFVSERSSKTTGAILPVDAGIREGFPR
ncbi:MAG: bifunctional rhamnulose-1-phosphate aldolase/short-chain dehydrogenase [Bacilli bacterium]